MCLGTKLSDGSLQRYKAKGKKCGYIRVWKVVWDNNKPKLCKYWPLCFYEKSFRVGFNHAKKSAEGEDKLIHAYIKLKNKDGWSGTKICCLVKPEWIKAVGKGIRGGSVSLTTKAIVMPEYPKRKVTVAEFRKAIKGKEVKTYSWEK